MSDADEKYLRDVTPVETVHFGNPAGGTPPLFKVDVYAVIEAFGVTCPATAHAVKKLLCAGLRGAKSRLVDLEESRVAIDRAIEMERVRAKRGDQ